VCGSWNLVAGDVYTINAARSLPAASSFVQFAVTVSPVVPSGVNVVQNTACLADDGANGPESNRSTTAPQTATRSTLRQTDHHENDGGMSSSPNN